MVRLRHRYLVTEFRLDGKDNVPDVNVLRSNSITDCLTTAIKQLHGIQGVALSKAGLLVKYISNSTNVLIIRMRRSAYKIVSSALPFVRQVDGHSLTFKTVYTGATIRHCNIFLVKYQRRKLEERYGALTSDLQRKLFEQEAASIKPFIVQMGVL